MTPTEPNSRTDAFYRRLEALEAEFRALRRERDEAWAARKTVESAASRPPDDRSSARLDEIEARARAATPGPWASGLAGVSVEDGDYLIRLEGGANATVNLTPATRFFVAQARQDVPWLVAQVRERDAEIALLREALDRARGTMDRVLECHVAAVRTECRHCSDALASGCADVAALLATVREAPDA